MKCAQLLSCGLVGWLLVESTMDWRIWKVFVGEGMSRRRELRNR